MSKSTKFDPNGPAPKDAGIFGLTYSEKEAKLVIIPVPWEATTSYGGGASKGPAAILQASHQVDLYDLELGNFYENGIYMQRVSSSILKLNSTAKKSAQSIIKSGAVIKTAAQKTALKKVNVASSQVNKFVYEQTSQLLSAGKTVGLVGGDHSTPFGCIKAHLEKYPKMGILHFDAHADLRNAYEGFEDSHASIMYNVIKKTSLQKLVQVGIRDFCEEEYNLIQKESTRIRVYFDEDISQAKHSGKSWNAICEQILADLPNEVYISFDIDGLDPQFCPHTGTPVPGGLDFQEALTLIKLIVKSGKKIIGFDLNEVAPGPGGDEWDANVGARMLFKLCGWTLKSITK